MPFLDLEQICLLAVLYHGHECHDGHESHNSRECHSSAQLSLIPLALVMLSSSWS